MNRPRTALLLALLLAPGGAPLLHSQAPAAVAPAPEESKLRVYLDCQWRCDFDYLRTEVRFVDYVRDRQDADVHILVTTQTTGAGGTEYNLRFIGQRAFENVTDDLRFATRPTETQDQARRAMARVLTGGLVRYAMRTPLADRLQLSFGDASPRPGAPAAAAKKRDPWNQWVFRTRVGGFFSGESSYKFQNLDGSISANRTTEGWKTVLSVSTRQRNSDIRVGSNSVINSQRDRSASALMVRSLTDHWSAGVRSSANQSTFLNRDMALRLAPALEYNIFPYAESTRRQLTLQYSLGANQIDYEEETLFGKAHEALLDQALSASYNVRQPWGSVRTSLEGSHYFHDRSKYRLEANGNLEFKLFKGVALNFFGSSERIRDQLHLPAGKLTPEQILLRQKQLATSFRYYGSVGLSYSFGSIYNNVVNPRMGSSGGGVIMMF